MTGRRRRATPNRAQGYPGVALADVCFLRLAAAGGSRPAQDHLIMSASGPVPGAVAPGSRARAPTCIPARRRALGTVPHECGGIRSRCGRAAARPSHGAGRRPERSLIDEPRTLRARARTLLGTRVWTRVHTRRASRVTRGTGRCNLAQRAAVDRTVTCDVDSGPRGRSCVGSCKHGNLGWSGSARPVSQGSAGRYTCEGSGVSGAATVLLCGKMVVDVLARCRWPRAGADSRADS